VERAAEELRREVACGWRDGRLVDAFLEQPEPLTDRRAHRLEGNHGG
jgi:hypothetical protein